MPQALGVKYTTGAAVSCRGPKGGGATGSTATSVVVAVRDGFGAVAPSTSSSVGSTTFSTNSLQNQTGNWFVDKRRVPQIWHCGSSNL